MENTNRREFLKGTAWMGATAALAGCATSATRLCGEARLALTAPALGTVRTGHIGLGMRGPGAVHRMASIPGVRVTALCDLYRSRVENQQKWLEKNGKPKAKAFSVYDGKADGTKDESAGWKALCESDDVDLVYITTPWALHTPIALYAMEHGKHVAIEVPAAMTLDECWALVETSERTGRHCMQLENCCYGEIEMLTLNLARQGKLGEVMHAEGAYIHDLRELCYLDPAHGGYQGYWRLKWNARHEGNPYPTHGLVPLMQVMNVNRGDRFDYLTCVSTGQVCMDAYARAKFGADSWQSAVRPTCGDMSTTLLRTVNGKTVMIQHNVNSPRPYSRINLVQGTLGVLNDYPFRIALADRPDGGAHEWFDAKKTAQLREEMKHPLWKAAGDLAVKMGGHGGMDFLMDLRLAYCLQNGLPLDMDVYDLATSCSLCELSERSVRDRGRTQDVPDFTRGGWKTAKPLGIETVDVSKMGLGTVKKDESALNV